MARGPAKPGSSPRDSRARPAWLVGVGAAVATAAAALHPATFDPNDAAAVLREVHAAPRLWVAVHVAFGAGVWLWTLGMVALARDLTGAGTAGWSAYAAPSLLAALPLWLAAMTLEAAALPRVAAVGVPGGLGPAWAATLAAGYVAALLEWLGALAIALDLAALSGPPGVLGRAGRVLLPIGMAGMVAAWLHPRGAALLLLLTVTPGALWSLALAWLHGSGRWLHR